MESCEILRETIEPYGVKAVATEMKLSPSLLYKWCEPKSGPGACGADNPLDRLLKLMRLTGNTGPVEWLCRQAGGFLVMNPAKKRAGSKVTLLKATQQILKEFSDVMEAVSDSYTDDANIDTAEAARIRKEWEELKSVAESFVVACEQGAHYTIAGTQ